MQQFIWCNSDNQLVAVNLDQVCFFWPMPRGTQIVFDNETKLTVDEDIADLLRLAEAPESDAPYIDAQSMDNMNRSP